MGFLDDLKDAFSKQATKPKANKTQGEKVVGNILTAVATLNGKTKEATIKVVSPTIKSVTWGIPIKQRKTKPKVTITTIDAKEIDKTANGVNTSLYIKTEQAERCNALIVLESEAWEGYFESHLILIGNTGKTDLKEQDTVVITPDTKHWKKTSTKNSKISATVYLFTYTSRTWSLEDNPEALALSFNRKLKSPNPSISPSCAEQFRRLIVHKSMKSEIDFDYCGHGMEYREGIFCTKNVLYGPIYYGITPMRNYAKWDELVNEGKITSTEKSAISAMADNEGEFEAAQSWDSEFVSLGAMQKTISPGKMELGRLKGAGEGELSTQIFEFQNEYKSAWEKYKCCFEHHQLTFTKEKGKCVTKYKGERPSESIRNEMRKEYNATNITKTANKSSALEPFIKLGYDKEFQDKQVLDFVKRMREALAKKILEYDNRKISEYIKSPLGMATVLDHSVNRPEHVVPCIKISLDRYIAAQKEKGVIIDKDPSKWGNNHSKYEKEILDIYGPLRGVKPSYTMTDATGRYTKLKNKLK